MRGPKRIDLKKIVDKGLDLAKRSAEVFEIISEEAYAVFTIQHFNHQDMNDRAPLMQ